MEVSEGASARLREASARAAIGDAPTLLQRDWLPPDSGWPGLDKLVTEQRRILDQLYEVANERSDLMTRFEAEDRASRETMTGEFLSGMPPTETLVPTPHDERTALIRDVEARHTAAFDSVVSWIGGAITSIEDDADQWLGDLANRRQGAEEQRCEAERLLAEARATEVELLRMDEWLRRNAGIHERPSFRNVPPFRFVAWSTMQNFTPPEKPEDDGMGGIRQQVVDPPRLPEWDAERQAAGASVARNQLGAPPRPGVIRRKPRAPVAPDGPFAA